MATGGEFAKSYNTLNGEVWRDGPSLDPFYGVFLKGAAVYARHRNSLINVLCGINGDNENTVKLVTCKYSKINWSESLLADIPGYFKLTKRSYMAVCMHNDTLWMVGGKEAGKELLYSINGGCLWTLKNDNPEFPQFEEGYLVIYKGIMFILSPEHSYPWYSKDNGLSWNKIDVWNTFGLEKISGVVILNNKLWVSTNTGLWEIEDTP